MNAGPGGKTRQKYQHFLIAPQLQMPSPNLLYTNLNLEPVARMLLTPPLLRGGKLALRIGPYDFRDH